ncbi:hypothetical protein FGO68_gene3424 [Halteria grandinella]|uniref:Uncharacterized protein n=1 Tax=Halteria grandinella TaxID=5974 RepID=A0A8J8T5F9_HALGN|nr:hypothetical protein FGO68_gene3424 [Halteria grandinella]
MFLHSRVNQCYSHFNQSVFSNERPITSRNCWVALAPKGKVRSTSSLGLGCDNSFRLEVLRWIILSDFKNIFLSFGESFFQCSDCPS